MTVYNGVDAGIFSSVEDGEKVRSEFNIPVADPLIGIVGQIARWKGHEVLVAAAPAIIESVPDARFLIVGGVIYDDGFADILRKNIGAAGLEERFIFTGFREDIASIFSALDVYVHPSIRPEPLGRSVLEAMAAGKAIVASNAGGIPELISSGAEGILVKPSDPGMLAEAVLSILGNRQFADRIGESAREKATQSFSMHFRLASRPLSAASSEPVTFMESSRNMRTLFHRKGNVADRTGGGA